MSHDNHRKMGHVQDFKVYLYVLIGLFILTVLTVWVSYFDFGPFNDVVAIAIASCKAALVILFFMHGRYEGKLIWAFIYYPLIILATLLAALFLDYANRPDEVRAVQAPSIIKSHHGDHDSDDHGTNSHGDSTHQEATPASGEDHGDTAKPATNDQGESHAEEKPADESTTDETSGGDEGGH